MPGPRDFHEFLSGFLAEADEHLLSVHQNLEAVAIRLESGQPEPRAVRELFRSLHTIKGLAAMVGVQPVVDVAHELESLLRTAERAGGRISEPAFDLLVQGIRAIEERVLALSKDRDVPAAPPALIEQLQAIQVSVTDSTVDQPHDLRLPKDVLRNLSAADREQLVQALRQGRRAVRIDFQPSPERAGRGLTIGSVRSRVAEHGDLVKVIPRTISTAPTGIAFSLLLATDATNEVLAQAAEVDPHDVEDIHAEHPSPAPVDDALPVRDEEVSEHGVIRVEVARLDDVLEQLSGLVVTRFRMERVMEALVKSGADVRELRTVMDESNRQLHRLRGAIMRARMVPVSDLLQRVPLIVRGLTRDTGKAASVKIRAGAAEVDKVVADRLFPAVVHLVRNAVDHAIEPTADRRAAGKPNEGRLRIECSDASGSHLLLRISDDGRGIDREAIARRIGRGGSDGVPSDEELLQLITTPGFSTRDAVSQTSGRGMGMDIVKRTVELLGGSLTLRTRPGEGTTFTIRVPVSMTIVDTFGFACGEQSFVAPVAMVDQIVDVDGAHLARPPSPEPHASQAVVIPYRGETIPLLSLTELLHRQAGVALPRKALIVRQDNASVALGVDRMLGQQEVVIRPLHDRLTQVAGITGATDLGDGRPTLVLDLYALAAAGTSSASVGRGTLHRTGGVA